jgi:hypothetical protein
MSGEKETTQADREEDQKARVQEKGPRILSIELMRQ